VELAPAPVTGAPALLSQAHQRQAPRTSHDKVTARDDRQEEGATTMSETVTRADAGGVATFTLLRPGLSHALRTDLLTAVQEVAADESVRAVLLTGSGRAFCVGQDLAEHIESLRGNAATSLSVVEDEYNPLILALSALRVPVVVGINGACAGAGLGIALAGDLRVAAAGSKFTTAFTGVGLSSDSALAARLVHCVGGSRAAQLLLTPDPFTAETAEQWGLVHRVVDAEQVLPEAQALAARLANGPTAAYRAMKTVLATAATDSLEETLALEARLQTRLGKTADHREAVEAFLEKRAPHFTGR
jgi:2-(1,2-epoxy-1,2-dihydrophenyl)acetyl-CoA isomerase